MPGREQETCGDPMDSLPIPILTDVLDVISTSNESLDSRLVRQKSLDALFRTIPSEGAIFFLPDGSGQYTHITLKNLDKDYCDYYKRYFYMFDPLNLTKNIKTTDTADSQEKVFSYDSFLNTEYYNDFLKPQKIHHKLIVNLIAEKELYGRIVLTRPRRSNSFTSKEVITVKTIAPYLAHALAHNNLRRKIKLKGTVLDYIEKESSIGMLLLDENLQIVYSNEKAEEVVGNLTLSRPALKHNAHLPSQLLKDCWEIKSRMNDCQSDGAAVVKQSTIQGRDEGNFSVTTRILDQRLDWEGSRLLMISIEEEQSAEEKSAAKIDPGRLQEAYHLSRREIEVVELVFLGLKNAEIAQKLFVSEVTVKKHLQNIYEKAGVNNRTSLINRILAY